MASRAYKYTQRDFEIAGAYTRQRNSNHWDNYTDEQELCPKRAKLGPCDSSCSFILFGKERGDRAKYYCKTHWRVHCCGMACQRQAINHENISCILTGEVLRDQNLFVDEINDTRLQKVDRCNHNTKQPDDASDKNRDVFVRIKGAFQEACSICKSALESASWKIENFERALYQYFQTIQKHTTYFKPQSIVTKRAALQFGLACIYIQRQGLTIDETKVFNQNKSLDANLPRTHSLLNLGLKVRAITRAQQALKDSLSTALKANPELNLKFPDINCKEVSTLESNQVFVKPTGKRKRSDQQK